MTTSKKILLVTNFDGMWPFSDQLLETYNKYGYESDVLDYNSHQFFNYKQRNERYTYFKEINNKWIPKRISKYPNNFLFQNQLKLQLKRLDNYHVILILYHSSFLNAFVKLFRAKTKKLVIIYCGSDFYRASKKQLKQNTQLLDGCDKIVFTNIGMAKDLTNYYNNYHSKFTLNQFGLKIVDCLIENSDKFSNKNSESIKITIGYNGSEHQQHIKIIQIIRDVVKTNAVADNIELVFPLTYAGNEKYIQEIKDLVSRSNLTAKFFEKKLTDFEIAELRVNSNIVINMQISDQASGSLVEYIATGNIMIVGEWLPYEFWDTFDFYYHKVNFDNLANKLNEILLNFSSEKIKSSINIPIVLNSFSTNSRLKEILQIVE